MEEGLSLLNQLKKEFKIKEVDIRQYSPLTLAYIGDAVFETVIRTVIVARGNRPVNCLHRSAIQYVNAGTQAAMADSLTDSLTDEEASVYRRGRNAKPYTTAKNASLADYKKATGFEALMGYLYLEGRMDRVIELTIKALSNIEMEL